jgi:glycosyltransferase involved in cell wall biosynthesis
MYIADRLVALLGVDSARIETVPHGVSGTFTSVQPEHDIAATCARFGVDPGRFAVCVGWVATRKNLIPVIRAIAQLRSERIPLVLVGPDGHGAETVDAEIARLDGTVRVLRTGFLSDEETAALVRGAGVLLHPSLGEGFGLVPLEAMAVGTPVIAARASSVPEVVGDAAVLIDQPLEPKAWGDALMDVMGTTERRAELAAAGEQWAATFSWERAARTMLQIYYDVARD